MHGNLSLMYVIHLALLCIVLSIKIRVSNANLQSETIHKATVLCTVKIDARDYWARWCHVTCVQFIN